MREPSSTTIPTATTSTAGKLGLLGALYLAQGLPYGFFSQALPAILRELELSLPAIGLSNLLALPWAAKFLWAPAVDRWGSRGAWILCLQAASIGMALVLAAIDPRSSLALLLAAVFVANVLAATQDIATDGLAVALLGRDERGWGNGVQVAGYRVGMILGGGALLLAYDKLGHAAAFGAMAALLAASSIPVLRRYKHPDIARRRGSGAARDAEGQDLEGEASKERASSERADPRGFLARDGAWAWLGAVALFKFGDYLAQGMLRPWLVDRGLALGELGVLLGFGGFAAGLLGAVVGGAVVGRLPRRRALVGFGALQASGLAAYGLAALVPGPAILWAAALYEHFVGGLATVALFTCMMDACRKQLGATDYSLQASLVVAATGAAAALSGLSAQALGYGGNFALAAGVGLLGVLAAARPGAMRVLDPGD